MIAGPALSRPCCKMSDGDPKRPCDRRADLPVDLADLRAFKSQIVHQAVLVEDEADHRARMFLVSIAPPAPIVMMATDPSTPTFQP